MNTQSPAHLQQQVQARLVHQHRAQQLAHDQQRVQRDHHSAAQAAHAAARDSANAPGGVMEHLPDGGEQARAAKRRKPTDRSLPAFTRSRAATSYEGPTADKLGPSTAALESLSASYSRLQAAERRLDWTVSRRKVDLAELLSAGPGGAGRAGVAKTLRVHLTTTIKDQAWQIVPNEPIKTPSPVAIDAAPVAEADADAAADPAPAPATTDVPASETAGDGVETETIKPDPASPDDAAMSVDAETQSAETQQPAETQPAETQPAETQPAESQPEPPAPATPADASPPPPATDKLLAVPRVEIAIGGALVGPDGQGRPFSALVKRVVVETDRDPALYDLVGPIEWARSPGSPPLPGVALTVPADQAFTATVSLYLSHTPERFALVPALAELLDCSELDRVGVLEKLWAYAKREGLVTETGVKCDAPMRKLFSNQTAVPFHHLPEYVNRFLGPLPPVVLKVPVTVTRPEREGEGEGEAAEGAEGVQVQTTRAFDVEVGVEDPSRGEMEAVQQRMRDEEHSLGRDVSGLDEKMALSAASTRSALAKREFLAQFAASPAAFLDRFLASQAADLSLLLQSGGDRAAAQGAVGGEAAWREAARHAGYWQAREEEAGGVGWVDEAAGVWARREVEGKVRKAVVAGRG